MKTRATRASVAAYIARRASPAQRVDCRELMSLMARVTGRKPKMWGPSIVGYGTYRYEYASGRTGEWPVTGFAIRGRELVVYLMTAGKKQAALLARLGPHRIGVSCLYFKRLDDLDRSVLRKLVTGSVAEVGRKYGEASQR